MTIALRPAKDATVKYPAIKVKLTGRDGNAFAIIGAVDKALRAAKVPDEERKAFRDECMSGNYDELLQTCLRWVDVR